MKLVITVDCGASMTKVVYELQKSSSERIKSYFWMPPEIERISSAELKEYFELKGWIGLADPIQQAYLKVEENYCYVVGKLARQFHPEDRVFQLKYENALYKIMSAIGVVLQKHQIKEKNLKRI